MTTRAAWASVGAWVWGTLRLVVVGLFAYQGVRWAGRGLPDVAVPWEGCVQQAAVNALVVVVWTLIATRFAKDSRWAGPRWRENPLCVVNPVLFFHLLGQSLVAFGAAYLADIAFTDRAGGSALGAAAIASGAGLLGGVYLALRSFRRKFRE